jgi:chemotaxis protein MotB
MSPRQYKNNVQGNAVVDWQTIYCSVVLILVVLFAMLISYSRVDKGKATELRGNLRGYDGAASDRDRKKVMPGSLQNSSELVDEAMRSLKKIETAAFPEGSATLERTHRGFKCKLKSDVLFPSGSALVNEKAYPYLDEMNRIAKEKDLFLKIEGHTDDVPIHNSDFPSNWELSTTRAVNVLRYFIKKGGLSANRLAAEGFGQYRPLASNSTPEGREQNRRIEIFLELDKKATLPRDTKQ